MAELETKQTKTSVNAFLTDIEDDQQRKDAKAIAKMMKVATGVSPKMWGTSIVGFGSYSYKYASGHEGEWPLTGFSPRKQNLSLYIMTGFKGYQPLRRSWASTRPARLVCTSSGSTTSTAKCCRS